MLSGRRTIGPPVPRTPFSASYLFRLLSYKTRYVPRLFTNDGLLFLEVSTAKRTGARPQWHPASVLSPRSSGPVCCGQCCCIGRSVVMEPMRLTPRGRSLHWSRPLNGSAPQRGKALLIEAVNCCNIASLAHFITSSRRENAPGPFACRQRGRATMSSNVGRRAQWPKKKQSVVVQPQGSSLDPVRLVRGSVVAEGVRSIDRWDGGPDPSECRRHRGHRQFQRGLAKFFAFAHRGKAKLAEEPDRGTGCLSTQSWQQTWSI